MKLAIHKIDILLNMLLLTLLLLTLFLTEAAAISSKFSVMKGDSGFVNLRSADPWSSVRTNMTLGFFFAAPAQL